MDDFHRKLYDMINSSPIEAIPMKPSCKENNKENDYVQWTIRGATTYSAVGETTPELPAGIYEIGESCGQIIFEKLKIVTSELVDFPESSSNAVIENIKDFWESEPEYRKYKIIYKRGIVLYGPPGSGKSSTIQFVCKDVIERGGVVIKFNNPHLFNMGMKIIRQVQKDLPIVVLMEDIDSILERFNESDILNLLDGVDQIDKVVFLATTNYPEKLQERIINRPSRFDMRFYIPLPNIECRKVYLKHLFKNYEGNLDLNKWAYDTADFSIAHIKELFTSVIILKTPYEKSLETLREMIKEKAKQTKSNKVIGFNQ